MPITVKRLSDNSTHTFADLSPQTKVGELKNHIVADFHPAHPK